MGKNNNKKKAKANRDLTATEVVHWLKAQVNMPHPLRTNPRVMFMWMKAMNTGLPEHILTTLRPAVMDLWQQYGSGFAWTRAQVDAALAMAGPDLREPVLTTQWQRQGPPPALADAYPRGDWPGYAAFLLQEEAARIAASEQQAGQATTQPAPVANQAAAAAPASSESAKEDKKEGAKKEGGLAQDADAAGNVRDLPPTTPRPTLQLPPGYVLRRDPGFDVFRERNSIDDLPSYPDLPPYTYPGPVPASRRPVAPANQQPRAAAGDEEMEVLQRKQYEEDLAKMEDQNEDEWTDEESVAAPEDDIARAESLQRNADFEELNRQFHRRFSQSRRSGRGDESSRRGPDGRSRSPVR